MSDEREAWRQRDEFRDRAARAEDALEECSLARNAAINESHALRERLAAAERETAEAQGRYDCVSDLLKAAEAKVRELERLRDMTDKMLEAADERAGYPRCACMVDGRDDVCMAHSPAVTKAKERIAELERWGRQIVEGNAGIPELLVAGAALLGLEE